jgi:DME family drug/metabolite transporter
VVLPAGTVATLTLAEPVVATVLGALLLGEHLGPDGLAGMTLVIAGLAMLGITTARTRRPLDQGQSAA